MRAPRHQGALRARRPVLRVAAWATLMLSGLAVVAVVVAVVGTESAPPVVGALSETARTLPAAVPAAELTDATGVWHLDTVGPSEFDDPMAGGSAVADVDSDGDLDLVVAHGDLRILRWGGAGYLPPVVVELGTALAVSTADVDSDGWTDLLVARARASDTIVWGGEWIERGTRPDTTEIGGSNTSGALLAGELTGDDRIDIVRLGRGARDSTDIVWEALTRRDFDPVELPDGDRLSLAGELIDVDHDGLLDIWVTRDVGWLEGGDSLFSRGGDPTGPWVDVAPRLGAALEVDGMGVTIADLDGDRVLDAYVSDIGDNEVLLGRTDGFEPATDTGAARIRPPGSADSVISSSWASGATDLNLDGRVDL
ncbi:MAG: FG-GAP repeat domain-containing protein, partial [Acidimicrobiales bacterium]